MSDDKKGWRIWCRHCMAETRIEHPGTTEQGRTACRKLDALCTCPKQLSDTEAKP